MPTLLEAIQTQKLGDRIFTERQLGDALGGTAARRYGIVNRALKDRMLLRLKRGLYTIAPQYRSASLHPFVVAQALLQGSYISFESALYHHGWTPEAVYTTASVSPERKSLDYDVEGVGRYTFSPLATNPYQFLVGVERKKFGDLTAFVASPLRALMDLVASRKLKWEGIGWLVDGMRIDPDEVALLPPEAFKALREVYKHKSALSFLTSLEAEVARLRHD